MVVSIRPGYEIVCAAGIFTTKKPKTRACELQVKVNSHVFLREAAHFRYSCGLKGTKKSQGKKFD
jgi:hypothetical protein